jgi:hypothetical protein
VDCAFGVLGPGRVKNISQTAGCRRIVTRSCAGLFNPRRNYEPLSGNSENNNDELFRHHTTLIKPQVAHCWKAIKGPRRIFLLQGDERRGRPCRALGLRQPARNRGAMRPLKGLRHGAARTISYSASFSIISVSSPSLRAFERAALLRKTLGHRGEPLDQLVGIDANFGRKFCHWC